MTGLPTVQVLLDDGTGSFPYDITNKVLLVSGLGFTRGRDDWQSSVTPGVLNLVLNNNDGRFSPGSTIIATPSPIKVDRQIRVKETIGGTTFTRYTGYAKSWPVSWPAVVGTVSTVKLTASDAQARAERRIMRSVIEEEIFADDPAQYFTLGEPSEATSAADTSGNQVPVLGITGSGGDVTFGQDTGPGTDGLTAANFTGNASTGKYLTGGSPVSGDGVSTTISFVLAFNTSSATGAVLLGEGLYIPGAVSSQIIDILATGEVATGIGATITSASTYADGETHVAHLVLNGATMTLYVDGVSVGSAAAGAFSTNFSLGIGLTGTIAHAASFNSALSGSRVLAQATAMLTGFSGEAGTTRITRFANRANLPLAGFDPSLTNVAHTDFTGRSAWDCIQEVADAEMGIAFINGSGNLAFHNRNRSPAKTTPDLTVVAASYLTADTEPTQDDQQIFNYLETTAAGTQVLQVARDAASESSHGRYSGSNTYLVLTDGEALDRANWIIANFAEPTTRFGTLTFNLYAMPAAIAVAVLTAVEINAWIRIVSTPSQMPGSTTVDVVVQGYSEIQNGGAWTLTCNVVARSLYSPVWILGNSTYGVLGSTTRLYV